MKKLLLSVLLLLGLAPFLLADEVALMKVRFGARKGEQNVAIEFFEGDAPATVQNFKKLARKKFYDGVAFHRAFPHMLVQTGDPLSRSKDRVKVGTGGPGYTLPPEIRRKHDAGTLSMARLPDKINPARMSNGSQFFICLAPMPEYDGQYTAFGRVIYGMETLDAISAAPTDSNDYPVERITIRSLRIIPRQELPPAPAATQPAAQPAAKRSWWRFWQ